MIDPLSIVDGDRFVPSELLRPVPIEPLRLPTEVVRPGRKVQLAR